jgi:transcriptional regulator GlxA family with amidase domain
LSEGCEVLLVEALRWAGGDHSTDPAGLLAGLRDPSLARALTAMHADIRADWTVARLAGIAGMSRSAFSAKFGSVVGCADRISDRLAHGGGPRCAGAGRPIA